MATRPIGDITTLLDLTNRDLQENDLFPLKSETTWFTRDKERRVLPFTPLVQEIPIRGPAAFGQYFSFDLGSLQTGDILFGTVLQIRLGHWLDDQTILRLLGSIYTYDVSGTAWEYANSIGSCIIQEAELEIDGKTVETIDGDFINVFNRVYPDYNTQVGIAYDHTGLISIPRLKALQQPRVWPTEDGVIHCVLPFFFGRNRYQDALPMIAIKEGLVKINITLRPFDECVRQLRGFRDTCTSTPLQQSFVFDSTLGPQQQIQAQIQIPQFQNVQLLTYGGIASGKLRETMLRDPFEILHREIQTFSFAEPMKYTVSKRAQENTITVQLPIEANHPIEEIIWFVRRKGVRDNNEWTNYSSVLERDWSPLQAKVPLLIKASIQINGITIVDAEESYFRQLLASRHKGGFASYSSFVYGYPFAQTPGEHQPSGSANASRMNNLRLTLEIQSPATGNDTEWEVKVFCVALNWLRFENGLANPMFDD